MFKYLEVGDVIYLKSDLANKRAVPYTHETLFVINTVLNDNYYLHLEGENTTSLNSHVRCIFDYFVKFKNPYSVETKIYDPFNYIEFFKHEEIELVDSKRRNLLLEKINKR